MYLKHVQPYVRHQKHISQIGYMDPIPHDRSHLTGTGPSSYGTGPIVFNKIGPVPTWTFS